MEAEAQRLAAELAADLERIRIEDEENLAAAEAARVEEERLAAEAEAQRLADEA